MARQNSFYRPGPRFRGRADPDLRFASAGTRSDKRTCVYRKLRFGRIGGAARRRAHETQYARSAEPYAVSGRPCSRNDGFASHCNNLRKSAGRGASAPRPTPPRGQRIRGGWTPSRYARLNPFTGPSRSWSRRPARGRARGAISSRPRAGALPARRPHSGPARTRHIPRKARRTRPHTR